MIFCHCIPYLPHKDMAYILNIQNSKKMEIIVDKSRLIAYNQNMIL